MGAGGELGGHPVEEDAVELGSGEFAPLRAHRGEDEADAGQLLSNGVERLAHRRQRLLREAGADAEPEPGRVDADPLDVSGDRLGRGAIEGDHGDAEVELGRRGAELGERVQAFGAGMVVRPHRAVAELRAALGQRPCDLGIEPGCHSEASAFSIAPWLRSLLPDLCAEVVTNSKSQLNHRQHISG